MRCVQKLVRNGNSTQITIPRPVLIFLGWLPGSPVVVDVLEDKTLHIRPLRLDDQAPRQMRPLLEGLGEPVAR